MAGDPAVFLVRNGGLLSRSNGWAVPVAGNLVIFVGEVGGTPLEACILRLSAWPH
jgi:hypothetical protein